MMAGEPVPYDPSDELEGSPLGRELKYKMYLMRKSPLAIMGLAIIMILVFVAIFAPSIAPYDPEEIDEDSVKAAPSGEHYFGTDNLGRDIYSMILHGARVSIKIGLIVVGISLGIGVLLGTLAGYYGGYVDEVIMRVTDMFMAFPALILAIAIVSIMTADDSKADRLTLILIALAVVGWPGYTRLVRGTVLSVKENTYVEAARAIGASNGRIAFMHVLPNCLSPIIVTSSMRMGSTILVAAGLSFLGLGAEVGTAEWGVMVASGVKYIVHHWWIATFPGLAILITVLGFNLFGDGLRDILDPKLRR